MTNPACTQPFSNWYYISSHTDACCADTAWDLTAATLSRLLTCNINTHNSPFEHFCRPTVLSLLAASTWTKSCNPSLASPNAPNKSPHIPPDSSAPDQFHPQPLPHSLSPHLLPSSLQLQDSQSTIIPTHCPHTFSDLVGQQLNVFYSASFSTPPHLSAKEQGSLRESWRPHTIWVRWLETHITFTGDHIDKKKTEMRTFLFP